MLNQGIPRASFGDGRFNWVAVGSRASNNPDLVGFGNLFWANFQDYSGDVKCDNESHRQGSKKYGGGEKVFNNWLHLAWDCGDLCFIYCT